MAGLLQLPFFWMQTLLNIDLFKNWAFLSVKNLGSNNENPSKLGKKTSSRKTINGLLLKFDKNLLILLG